MVPEPIALSRLLSSLQPEHRLNWVDLPVTSITDDSRQASPKSLFVAVPGENMDGHRFIPDALRKGACAVVCEKIPSHPPPCPLVQVADSRLALSALAAAFHGEAAKELCVVGITGTDGKTTTTELVLAILKEAGHRTGSLGTIQYRLGTRVADSEQTTPHPLALHAMLREMRRAALSHVVMECSSHGLAQRRTAHVPFRVGVLTQVARDHLDYHGTMEAYLGAKQRLFEQLPADSAAVLNADSPVCERYRKAAGPANVLTYGVQAPAEVKLEARRGDIRGARMLIHTPHETYAVESSLVGEFNCENVLAAAAVAFALGIPGEVVRTALGRFKGVPGRMEKIEGPPGADWPSLFVDYSHTPNALRKVLNALRPLTKGRLVCVFGCGGDRDRQKRPLMGEAATSLADLAVITADNSRSERTVDIIEQIAEGITRADARYVTEPDRRRAIETAVAGAGPRDVIALCGRGCEQFQTLGERRIPFDDRLVAREVLRAQPTDRKKSA